MAAKTNLLGQRFGRLLVVGETTERDYSFVVWACRCDCGAFIAANTNSLRRGKTNSCGCLRSDLRTVKNVTHGGAFGKNKERLYRLWKSMRARCSNPNLPFAHRYVERGITVCAEWAEYSPFREWSLQNGYADNLSLDRVDNDGNYGPSNCRWVDRATQANNRSNNVFICVGGERLTATQACQRFGISLTTYQRRRRRGLPPEVAATVPPRAKRKSKQ